MDDENEIPLKEIAWFSAVRFALPSIPLIVLHSLVRYVIIIFRLKESNSDSLEERRKHDKL